MFPLIEGFPSSGIHLEDYCKQHGFNDYTYRYWLGKYRKEQKEKDSDSLSFIPLEVASPIMEQHNLHIEYPNGVRICLSANLNTTSILTLKKLVLCLD